MIPLDIIDIHGICTNYYGFWHPIKILDILGIELVLYNIAQLVKQLPYLEDLRCGTWGIRYIPDKATPKEYCNIMISTYSPLSRNLKGFRVRNFWEKPSTADIIRCVL